MRFKDRSLIEYIKSDKNKDWHWKKYTTFLVEFNNGSERVWRIRFFGRKNDNIETY